MFPRDKINLRQRLVNRSLTKISSRTSGDFILPVRGRCEVAGEEADLGVEEGFFDSEEGGLGGVAHCCRLGWYLCALIIWSGVREDAIWN